MNISLSSIKAGEFGIVEFVVSELFSLTVGIICMLAYRLYFSKVMDRNESLARSFILIAPSVSAIFWAIQYSLPLSLGLLGALSFVRFRTPIKKSEDVGFILLVIALSLLSSVYRFLAAGILLLIVISVVVAKSSLIDKRIRLFKTGTHLTIFTLSRAKEFERSDKKIREVLLQEFAGLRDSDLVLSDIVPKGSGYSFSYSLYFKRYDESIMPRIIARLEKVESIERSEVFREKIAA
ncbi:MAG: DUF4956 domain-containing protein [Candidatus Omnitrophota bacterium]